MSGRKRCRGQWPSRGSSPAGRIEDSWSNVSPERELQVLGKIKKKDWQMPSGVGHVAHSEL